MSFFSLSLSSDRDTLEVACNGEIVESMVSNYIGLGDNRARGKGGVKRGGREGGGEDISSAGRIQKLSNENKKVKDGARRKYI